MKEGWEIKKLGEIAYIGLGFTHTPEYVESGVPFLSVKDISSGEICWENVKFVSQEEYDSAPKGAKPQKGDIMFCRVGTMGKPVIVTTDTPFCTFVSLGYLHLLNNNISNIYIKYWMQSNAFDIQVKANVKGVAIKNLNTGWLKEFTLPIPPIAEQEKIVAELDCLSGIIEKKKQQLKEYDALAQSIFYEMFGDPNLNDKGWEEKKISEICENLDYRRRPITAKDRIPGLIPYYGASGIVDYVEDYIFDGTYLLVSEDGANLLMRSTPIAFTISGKTWVNNHAHVLEFSNYSMHLFIQYFLNLLDLSNIVRGCAQPKLTQASLNEIRVFDIPMECLEEFASKIEAIEKQKALIKKSIEEIETLFNSRMDLYFN